MTQRASLTLLTLLWVLISSPQVAQAHGDAVLCDAQGDLIEQCGETHECVTDPEVSESIGYCKAEGEDISFTLCDREASESTCGEGEVCKIGTIDPRIGVCAEVTATPIAGGEMAGGETAGGETAGGDSHDHEEHDHGGAHEHAGAEADDHDHDHGCHSGHGRAPAEVLLAFLFCVWALSRRVRDDRHD